MSKETPNNKSKSLPFWNAIRKHFLTGVGTLFPLVVTFYIVIVIVRFADKIVGNYVNTYLFSQYGFKIFGLGVIISLIGIFVVGILYNYFFGRKLMLIFENILKRLPLISNIYPSAKELSQFLFDSDKNKKFDKVVSVEFPQPGTYSIGFITNEQIQELSFDKDQELIAVFIPLAPTPISGFIILLPKDKVRELDISVDKAVKFIVSGGVVLAK